MAKIAVALQQVPQEHRHARFAEQIVAFTVSQTMEEIADTVQHVPQESQQA